MRATSAASSTRLAAHPDWWRVRDVMTTCVVRATPSMTYDELVDLLLAHDISGLPVTDDAGRLLGIVTEADLVRHEAGRTSAAAGGPHDAPAPGDAAAELMTSPAVTASPDDDLPTTASTLLDNGYRRLPVVAADGRLVGIVSRRDLLTPAWADANAER
jgi:CBS domain-containing protein